ncbi:two-component system regulatory protein [Salinisphaera dokdonensis CL-ES53]|uniref:Two-component system regulatory protein n=1 Tax=Salinisphaera dokdonensis CL-ES53 TaxID=1304272 RepID=A0ABV2B436_9GAMM
MDVLIIEADDQRAIDIGDYLTQHGHEPDFASDSRLAVRLCEMYRYDAIILDPDPPRLDDSTLCARLRADMCTQAPILVVCDDASDNPDAESNHLNCLSAPAALPALYERLEAAVYRKRRNAHEICSASLYLDPDLIAAHCAGETVPLAPTSYRILELLVRWHPQVVTRREIENTVWPDAPPASEAALRGHIHRLRHLLAEVGGESLIRTVHGVGYQLADRASA